MNSLIFLVIAGAFLTTLTGGSSNNSVEQDRSVQASKDLARELKRYNDNHMNRS